MNCEDITCRRCKPVKDRGKPGDADEVEMVLRSVGSLWRVDWVEIAEAWLAQQAEDSKWASGC